MKLYLFFSLNLFISVGSIAQTSSPIINHSWLPNIGETFIFKTADSTNISIGDSGINVTWNFQNLRSSNKNDTIQFIDPFNTPFYTNFSTSNIAEINDGVYTYYKNMIDGWHITGTASLGELPKEQEFIFLPLPISFDSIKQLTNIIASDYYDFNKDSTYIISISNNSIVKADAYGTLILPDDTIANVLRLHIISNMSTVISSDNIISNRTDSYMWLTPNTHHFLLMILINKYSGYGEDYISQNISYQKL